MTGEMTNKMTDSELDQSYTDLCHALASVGEANAQPFLAMLCLSLMARGESAAQVLPLIAQAQAKCSLQSN